MNKRVFHYFLSNVVGKNWNIWQWDKCMHFWLTFLKLRSLSMSLGTVLTGHKLCRSLKYVFLVLLKFSLKFLWNSWYTIWFHLNKIARIFFDSLLQYLLRLVEVGVREKGLLTSILSFIVLRTKINLYATSKFWW